MPILIGIAGCAGVGKDTVADFLWERHDFVKIAFADALRDAAASMFGVRSDAFLDRKMKEEVIDYWGMSPRRMLQLLGNEAVKPVFGPEVWLKRWFLSFTTIQATDDVVVPDVRFNLEADALRHLGGVIVHLTRPGTFLGGPAGQHASEQGITVEPGDLHVTNDGDLKQLYARVDELVGTIK